MEEKYRQLLICRATYIYKQKYPRRKDYPPLMAVREARKELKREWRTDIYDQIGRKELWKITEEVRLSHQVLMKEDSNATGARKPTGGAGAAP